MIVLCGAVRRTPLARSIGRSILDLPLSDGTTLAERHVAGAARYAAGHGQGSLFVRLLVDTESEPPRVLGQASGATSAVERDASPIRGVAGVLSDATREYDDDDLVVVVNGSQLFLDPVEDLIEAMVGEGSDVAMVASADGTPVGIWLIRCAVLRGVRRVGYVDLKEQALPEWLGRWKVRVVERQRAYAVRTRTVGEYLVAVRLDAGGGGGSSVDEDPYREEWERSFGIVEEGATVGAGVTVHDSVVLRGGVVGRGALVVRSVVCPGAVVRAGARVVGQVFAEGGRV